MNASDKVSSSNTAIGNASSIDQTVGQPMDQPSRPQMLAFAGSADGFNRSKAGSSLPMLSYMTDHLGSISSPPYDHRISRRILVKSLAAMVVVALLGIAVNADNQPVATPATPINSSLQHSGQLKFNTSGTQSTPDTSVNTNSVVNNGLNTPDQTNPTTTAPTVKVTVNGQSIPVPSSGSSTTTVNGNGSPSTVTIQQSQTGSGYSHSSNFTSTTVNNVNTNSSTSIRSSTTFDSSP